LHRKNREIIPELLKSRNANSAIIEAIAFHFKTLPPEMQILLEDFSEEETANNIVTSIDGHFENIPRRQRNKIIQKMLEWDYIKQSTISILAGHYSSLSQKMKIRLYQEIILPENFEGLLWAICQYYENLPQEIQKLLLERISDRKFMKKGSNTSIAGEIISECFEILPEGPDIEILKQLSYYPEAGGWVEDVVFDCHEMIPAKYRKAILINLLKNNTDSFEFIYSTLASYYRELPVPLRNNTLRDVLTQKLPDSFYLQMKKNYFAIIPSDLKVIIQDRLSELKASSE
jgi:hypothetical protein